MDYTKKLKYHFKTKKGWVNDPNGLVWYNGYYHVFYQHTPDSETPDLHGRMYWGHAITKDFLNWQELPVALCPETDYDRGGCWSGTAIVKDDVLYLFYASIETVDEGETKRKIQRVSVAYSNDGINFEKYKGNPVIDHYPPEGGPDFRDPAVTCIDGIYYCVMASGNPETRKGRLLLYKSEDLFNWQYVGVMSEWDNCRYTECPSFMPAADGKYLLAASVCPYDKDHYFSIMHGKFENCVFTPEIIGFVDKGPDQYAGQVFRDHKGRNILISWIPGWSYIGYAGKDVGCMSLPREIFVKDGVTYGYPVEEVRHLLKDSDEAVKMTDDGFVVERQGRDPLVYRGKIDDIKILRDEFILEIYVNGGQEIYSVLL